MRDRGHVRRLSSGSEAHDNAPSDVGQQENEGATPEKSNADLEEQKRLRNEEKGWSYSDEDGTRHGLGAGRGKSRIWGTRRRAAITTGVIATLLTGGTLGILSVTSGPFKLIQAAQLLQQFHFSNDEEFMDSRAGKAIQWMRTRNAQERRNLSFFGNKIADRYESRLRKAGMVPDYENGRIRALTYDTNNPRALDALNELQARDEGRITINEPDANGRVRVDLPGGANSTGLRRSILKSAISSIGYNKITASGARRILARRAGVDWHPFRNIARDIDEEFWDFVKKWREDAEEKYKTGELDPEARNPDGDEDEDRRFSADEDPDGDGERSPDAPSEDLAREADEIVGSGDIPSIKGRLTSLISGGVGAASVATLICGLDQLGDSIPELRQAALVLPLMRIGMDIVSQGNQVMAGHNMNTDEIGASVTRFFVRNAAAGAKEFFEARPVQAALGQNQVGLDMPNGSKPNIARPQVFQVINVITAATGVSQVCSFVTSTAGGWVVDIADWATSGGPAQAILAAVTDTLSGVVLGSFVDDIARWIAGKPLALDAAGALLGDFAMFGVRLAANEGAIAHGGVALSGTQSMELREDTNRYALSEFQQKSAYDRYLNPYEVNSFVSKAMIQNSEQLSSPGATIATLLSSPLKTFSSLFASAGSVFSPRLLAAPGNYDYGFPEFGYGLETMDNPRYENPFENADRVEPHLAEYNERFGDCFGTIVDPQDFRILTKGREGVRYDLLEEGADNDDGNYSECGGTDVLGASTGNQAGQVLATATQEFNDYRVYLADQYTIKFMACFENLDQDSCNEVMHGISADEVTDGGGGGGGTATGSGCNPDGPPVPQSETVEVNPGMLVNRCIETNIRSLLSAAHGAGVGLGGSGWRDTQRQRELYIQNCGSLSAPRSACSPPTATPGNSQHERGLAMDFTCNGGGTVRHGDECWNWLVAHAAEYGLINLPSESWHWSTTGR